jgi:hypothetical protein
MARSRTLAKRACGTLAKREMSEERLLVICPAICVVVSLAPAAFAWRGGGMIRRQLEEPDHDGA